MMTFKSFLLETFDGEFSHMPLDESTNFLPFHKVLGKSGYKVTKKDGKSRTYEHSDGHMVKLTGGKKAVSGWNYHPNKGIGNEEGSGIKQLESHLQKIHKHVIKEEEDEIT